MSMPLVMAGEGTPLRLVSVNGGAGLRRRLADLGLGPGVALRLVHGGGGGPLIIALRDDSRLALGRGMALKIMVDVETASEERYGAATYHRPGR